MSKRRDTTSALSINAVNDDWDRRVVQPRDREEKLPLLTPASRLSARRQGAPKFQQHADVNVAPRQRRRRASLHLPQDEEIGVPQAADGFYTDGQDWQDPVDRVSSYCTCDSYRIKPLYQAIKANPQRYNVSAFLRDCVHISVKRTERGLDTSIFDSHDERDSDMEFRQHFEAQIKKGDWPEEKAPRRRRRHKAKGKPKDLASVRHQLDEHGQVPASSGDDNSSDSPTAMSAELSEGPGSSASSHATSTVARRTRRQEAEEKNTAHAFVFEYGVVVCWGMTAVEEHHVLYLIKAFEVEPSEIYEKDDFTYKYSDTTVKIVNDCIQMKDRDWLTKLSFSHALAQSSKLAAFEDEIDEIIVETKHIPLELAKHGKIKLSKNQTSKTMGRLGLHLFRINLQSDILDTPDFFWDQPDLLESQYSLCLKYLDVRQRVEVLNRRLSILYDLFEMLRNEQHNAHGSNLEIIVIILIFVEIVIEVINYIVPNTKLFA